MSEIRPVPLAPGMSVEVAAGLAGISKGYLSMLERGQRRFERRGLLEDLAAALGCAVADLTGQPYLPVDRASADALACLPAISVALHDSTLTDGPAVASWRLWTVRCSRCCGGCAAPAVRAGGVRRCALDARSRRHSQPGSCTRTGAVSGRRWLS